MSKHVEPFGLNARMELNCSSSGLTEYFGDQDEIIAPVQRGMRDPVHVTPTAKPTQKPTTTFPGELVAEGKAINAAQDTSEFWTP